MKVLVPVADVLFGSAIAHFIGQHQWPDNTEFQVVTIIEPFLLRQSRAPLQALFERASRDIIEGAKSTVEAVASAIRRSVSSAVVVTQVIEGHTSDDLIAIATGWPADLIVAGSHGRNGWSRLFLGSTSLILTSEAPCPVLLVKPEQTTIELWESLDEKSSAKNLIEKSLVEVYNNQNPRKILVAVDETSLSSDLIELVEKHNWVEPAEFKLVRVYHTPSYLSFLSAQDLNEINQDAIQEQRSSLRKLALELRSYFHSPRIEELLTEGDPKVKIVEAAREWGADLIIVGNHADPVRKTVLGSVSLSILCAAPCSVLLLREPKVARVKDAQKKLQSKALA